MSKYNRKKENPTTVSTDEFVGFWQQTFEKVRPFARAIAWGLVGFVGVVAVVGVTSTYLEQRAEGATEAWGHVVRVYDNELQSDEVKTPAETKDGEKDSKDAKLPKFKTAKERAEATLAELDNLPSRAAKNGKLFRAGVLYDLERWDEAKTAYDAAANEGLPPELAAIARQGVALCLEQLGKTDEALAAFEKIAPKDDKATEFMRDQALFGMGRVHEKKGDKAKAIEAYKEIIAKFPQSVVREDAQNRLAVLESP